MPGTPGAGQIKSNQPGSSTKSETVGSSGNSQAASNAAAESKGEAAAASQTQPETLSFEQFNRGGSATSEDTLYYPNKLSGSTGQTDYVRFLFKQYTPPFSLSTARGDQKGYNASIVPGTDVLKDDTELKPVVLYMPEDIQAQYGAQWGGKSIQNLTGSILQTASGAAQLNPGKFLEGLGNSASTESAFIALTNKALDALQKTGQGEGLQVNDVFSSTSGVVINPNTELLFQGFDLRTFTLTFKMVASTSKEATDIKKIITRFKKAMLPTINSSTKYQDEGNANDSRNFIGVPSLVIVDFMQGSSLNPYITQFKPCAITSLNVNYTPDGAYSTYYTGAPVAVILQLGFSETKLVYREDIYEDKPSY
jgi:hypothetical protein